MIAAAILLNITPMLSTFNQTFLRELQNRFNRPLLLVILFFADISIIILFARLSLMPCSLMHNTDFEAARNTPENVPINAVFMDLAGFAASAAAPPEVRVVSEGVEGGESIKSNIRSKWQLQRYISLAGILTLHKHLARHIVVPQHALAAVCNLTRDTGFPSSLCCPAPMQSNSCSRQHIRPGRARSS
jgi:hypothetical protein